MGSDQSKFISDFWIFCYLTRPLMSNAKKNYYTNLVSIKKIWDQMECILHKKTNFRIVHAIPNLVALSMIFFISKIAKIRDTPQSAKSDSNIYHELTPPAAPNPLLTFSQISESNVSKLIRSSPSKSCDLDPCPTQIDKYSAHILAGSITMIINLSVAEGKFPDAFKIAHVTPLLKTLH